MVRSLRIQGIHVRYANHAKDLSVGTGAGSRRVAMYLQKRLAKSGGRTRRISQLSKVWKGAAQLFNTGAWTSGTFGHQAMGLSPADMDEVRTQAANASGSADRARCKTTLIAITIGDEADPAVKGPREQVKE